MRCRMNAHFAALPENYLFSTIRRRVDAYQSAHPEKRILSLGIGDVTRPLSASSVDAMCSAAQELSVQETFRGYPPDAGYDFLRDAICRHYAAYGVVLAREEIYCGDGAKSDLGNLTDIFGDNEVWIPDPVYPAYVDANVMAGRRIRYLQGGADTLPSPDETADGEGYVVYLCSPNNPTGAAYDRDGLAAWVRFALRTGSVLLYDAAYEAFITTDAPHSIFAIPGSPKDGAPFTVGVRDPKGSENAYFATLSLYGGFVSTSGSYEKKFEQDGKTYHHLLDLTTGYPAETDLCAVTVTANTGLQSDALSTLCFLLGEEKSLPILQEYGAEAIFVYTDKTVHVTGGLSSALQITDSTYQAEAV